MVATTEEKKRRVTLWIEEEAITAGQRLAKAENRSFNNFVETLLMRKVGSSPESSASHSRRARLSVKPKHKKAGSQ